MKPVLAALLAFLIGCLVLAVVIYVARLVLGMLALPAPLGEIALLILGLIGFLALIYLCLNVYRSGGPPL